MYIGLHVKYALFLPDFNELIMDWIRRERRKRGRPRKLEPDQWRNREEWRLVCGRRRQVLKTGQIDRFLMKPEFYRHIFVKLK